MKRFLLWVLHTITNRTRRWNFSRNRPNCSRTLRVIDVCVLRFSTVAWCIQICIFFLFLAAGAAAAAPAAAAKAAAPVEEEVDALDGKRNRGLATSLEFLTPCHPSLPFTVWWRLQLSKATHALKLPCPPYYFFSFLLLPYLSIIISPASVNSSLISPTPFFLPSGGMDMFGGGGAKTGDY